ISGIDHDRLVRIARENSLAIKSLPAAPPDLITARKPRVGLYRAWVPVIDEGWTRWILEQFDFGPVTLRNGDIQAGQLRERFDVIVVPDSSNEEIMNGFQPGTIAGEFAGGLRGAGASALREFVQSGGTLITFNNASLFAIAQFGLPVTNVLAELKPDQFYCSGSLLQVELKDQHHPAVCGM